MELDIIKKTFDLLVKIGVQPSDLKIVIGPHIKKDSYCFPAPLENSSDVLTPYLHPVADKVCIDLVSCTADQLKRAGVPEENVEISPIDTFTSPDHFSHSRSLATGEPEKRMITLVQFTA